MSTQAHRTMIPHVPLQMPVLVGEGVLRFPEATVFLSAPVTTWVDGTRIAVSARMAWCPFVARMVDSVGHCGPTLASLDPTVRHRPRGLGESGCWWPTVTGFVAATTAGSVVPDLMTEERTHGISCWALAECGAVVEVQ